MTITCPPSCTSGLHVVETDDGIFIGTLKQTPNGLLLYTGFRGHPRHIDADEVVAITPAERHPDVVLL